MGNLHESQRYGQKKSKYQCQQRDFDGDAGGCQQVSGIFGDNTEIKIHNANLQVSYNYAFKLISCKIYAIKNKPILLYLSRRKAEDY